MGKASKSGSSKGSGSMPKYPKGHAPQVTGKGSVKHYRSSKLRPPFSKVLD